VRRPYDQSVAILKERIDVIGEPLASLDRRPQHDDEVLGPSIFRMIVEDVAVNELSLPCLYVGRSKLQRVSFTSSDLHLSAINWSDLVECDFSRASLVDADLRACNFASCVFTGADLSGADLRGSSSRAARSRGRSCEAPSSIALVSASASGLERRKRPCRCLMDSGPRSLGAKIRLNRAEAESKLREPRAEALVRQRLFQRVELDVGGRHQQQRQEQAQ
jgi:hypothetical protein